MLIKVLNSYEKYNYSVMGFLTNLLDDTLDKFKDGLSTLKDINPELVSMILKENPQLTGFLEQIKNKND